MVTMKITIVFTYIIFVTYDILGCSASSVLTRSNNRFLKKAKAKSKGKVEKSKTSKMTNDSQNDSFAVASQETLTTCSQEVTPMMDASSIRCDEKRTIATIGLLSGAIFAFIAVLVGTTVPFLIPVTAGLLTQGSHFLNLLPCDSGYIFATHEEFIRSVTKHVLKNEACKFESKMYNVNRRIHTSYNEKGFAEAQLTGSNESLSSTATVLESLLDTALAYPHIFVRQLSLLGMLYAEINMIRVLRTTEKNVCDDIAKRAVQELKDIAKAVEIVRSDFSVEKADKTLDCRTSCWPVDGSVFFQHDCDSPMLDNLEPPLLSQILGFVYGWDCWDYEQREEKNRRHRANIIKEYSIRNEIWWNSVKEYYNAFQKISETTVNDWKKLCGKGVCVPEQGDTCTCVTNEACGTNYACDFQGICKKILLRPTPSPIDDPIRTNVALGKDTSQSETPYGALGQSSRAVDGNINGRWESGSVTHTLKNGWWKVNLGGYYAIARINIFNRQDCCSDRLRYFKIEMFYRDQRVWYQRYNGIPSYVTDLRFDDLRADTVKISIDRGEPLSLAEVQVFGWWIDDDLDD